MDHNTLISIILFAPLLGFFINCFRLRSHNANISGGVATAAVAVSFIASVIAVGQLVGLPEAERVLKADLFPWIVVDTFKIHFSFVIDQISAIMILVITGVGTLIHLFSIGYMHHDKGVTKYFAYLNLFVFNMLVLVLGDSLLTMFVGWEGVGLCSYLLIGFWFSDAAKAAAGMKAFVMNRIGDAAFLLGIFVLFQLFGTINFSDLNAMAPQTPALGWLDPLTLGTLFLFIGATGKSAQIPLFVWLPDAMAGPTPVSALIHAATMVTAGVYMIVRLNGIFIAAPNTMFVIALIGALTAVMAATIGVTQNDIKKVLAYSTVSQLGYMFLAVGVGAFGAGMFHLMTHAFFKALMFLGSGSVIHAMHEEQDIRKMGGLRKQLPWTHLTFLFGWLAIIGLPPFAGFFSKDEILWMSFHSPFGHVSLWVLGAIGATLTAFYMTRLMAMTFWGESRVPAKVHPHESPMIMLFPLFVLALLSIVGGWVGIPHLIGSVLPGHPDNLLMNWFKPLITPIPGLEEGVPATEALLMLLSILFAVVSAFIAYQFYVKKPQMPKKIANSLGPIYRLIEGKYFVDELYYKGIVDPLVRGSKALWVYVDVQVIDRTTYLLADLIKGAGQFVRSLQTGNMQQYAMYFGIGLVFTLALILAR